MTPDRSNGPFRGQKATLYEGGIRVPMIVRWPGRVKPHTTSGVPWGFWDVLPTLAALAGTRAPDGLDRQANTLRADTMIQAVRMGDWKAVRPRPGAPSQLYDLAHDVSEANDVAARHPDIVSKIETYLTTARTPPRPHDTGSFEYRR